MVSLLRVGHLQTGFTLQLFLLGLFCLRAGRGPLLEEIRHVSNLRAKKEEARCFYFEKLRWEKLSAEGLSWETHSEHGDESPLQQAHQDVAPVVLKVGDASVSDIKRERHQEELDGGSNQSSPLTLHSGMDVQLWTEKQQKWVRLYTKWKEDDLWMLI